MEPENAGLSTADMHADPVDIEFLNVTKLYGDVVALDNTNLKIPCGYFHSIKGRITNRIYLGHQAEFRVVTESLGEILARIPKTAEAVSRNLAPGDAVLLGWQWDLGLAMLDG